MASLIGTKKKDSLIGTNGNDVINGLEGNDTLIGGRGNDRIVGGAGNDLIRGGLGFDSLSGGTGADRLFGDAGNDLLSGGDGSDILDGGLGNDELRGGLGVDTAVFAGSSTSYTFSMSASYIELNTGSFTDRVARDVEFLKFADRTIDLRLPTLVGAGDAGTVNEDGNTTINVLANDTSSFGTLTASNIGSFTQGAKGSVTKNSDGTFTYTANPNATGADSFTYSLTGIPGQAPVTVTVSVTITAANDAPATSAAGSASGNEDNNISGTVSAIDADGDTLAYAVPSSGAGAPSHGTVAINASTGAYVYTPVLNYNGTDSFTVTVSDGNGGTATQVVTVTVNPVQDAPIANADSLAADVGQVFSGNVLTNDQEFDGETLAVSQVNGAALNVGVPVSTTGGGSVTVNANGTYTYVPNSATLDLGVGETSTDSFTYQVSDGHGGFATATANITINGVAKDFILTTNTDLGVLAAAPFKGTAGNDTYEGYVSDSNPSISTFTLDDGFDAGAGTDTFYLESGGVSTGTVTDAMMGDVTNVEKIVVREGSSIVMTLGTSANHGAGSVNSISVEDTSSLGLTVQSGFTGNLSVDLDAGVDAEDGVDTVDASASSSALTIHSILGNLTDSDVLKGGTGSGDTLNLTSFANGTQAASLSGVSGIETINVTEVSGGTGPGVVSINVGSAGVVDTGKTLTVNAGGLIADFVFNGVVETTSIGDFIVTSGSGDDSLTGGDGNDTLSSGGGDDVIDGGDGTNDLNGGAGNDTITGGTFRDTVQGGAGDDYISSGTGNDIINGGADNDTIAMLAPEEDASPLTYEDMVDGSTGTDTLLINRDLVDLDLMNTVNVEDLKLDVAGLTVTLGSEATGGGSGLTGTGFGKVVGTSGSDTINLTANFSKAITIDLSAGGDDTVNAAYVDKTAGAVTIEADVSDITADDALTANWSVAGNTLNLKADDGTATLSGVSGFQTVNVIENDGAAATISLGAEVDTVVPEGETMVIIASALTGVLTLNGGDETDGALDVTGGSAGDSITTGGGDDIVDAGAGNNTVTTGAGADTIDSGSGDDTIDAGDGLNTVNAGDGTNTVDSGTGNDIIDSGAGDDTIRAGAGNNTVRAGNGVNTVTTLGGDDNITTGTGADTINAGAGTNTINAGGGTDTINVSTGIDTINAGAGDDQLNFGTNLTDGDSVDGGADKDTLTTSGDLVDAQFKNVVNVETLALSGHLDGEDTIGDTVVLGAEANGGGLGLTGSGIKTVVGTEYNDSITLTAGFTGPLTVDLLTNPGGIDTVDGSLASSTVTVKVRASDLTATTTLPGLPPLTLDTTIPGDTLKGGTGLNDTILLTADSGTATLDGDDGGFERITVVADGENTVAIIVDHDDVVAANGTLTVDGSALTDAAATMTFDGSAITTSTKKFNVTGGANNDSITGGAGADTLNGGDGADTLSGGGGNDAITGGLGNDIVLGGAGIDTITGGDGDDIINGGAGNDIINAGLGADRIVILGSGNLSGEAGVGDANVSAGGLDTVNLGADNDQDSIIFDLGTNPSGVSQITNFDAKNTEDEVEDLIVIQSGSTVGWSDDGEGNFNVLLQSDDITASATLVILDNTPTGFVSIADAASAADAIQAGGQSTSYMFAWADTAGLVHITYAERDPFSDINQVDQFKELATLSNVSLTDLTLENFRFLKVDEPL